MKCTIEAKILPFAGVSGHLYLEVFDETGARICQINGLATDRRTRKTKSIGFPGDFIKAYVSDTGGAMLAASAHCNRDGHVHDGRIIFEGTREEIFRALDAVRKRAEEINKTDAPYKLLSLNSNTVFMEMLTALETEIVIDRKAVKSLLRSKPALPGSATDFNKAVAKKDKKPPKNPHTPKP